MPYTYVYVPPEQIVDNMFFINCNNYTCRLDKELVALDGLKFTELLKICQKIKVFARRRGTKDLMISEIKRILTFEIPEDVYITNDI